MSTRMDNGITIGAKHYQNPDELKAEKDETQTALIKKAVMVKDSELLVWLSNIYGDNLRSTDTFGNLGIQEQFFLLGLMPFLSFKELNGSIRVLQDLIDSCPGKLDFFETYAAQGLPLTERNCGNRKTPIDYAVCNFNELSAKHGAGTICNLIRLLCSLGADVNESSGNNTFPLLNAHNAKNDELVKLLLELGADENQYNKTIEQRAEQERIERERKEAQEKKEREDRERRAEQERIERERKEAQEKKEREDRERRKRETEKRIAGQKAKEKRKAIVRKTVLIMAPLIIVTSGAAFFVVRQKNIAKEMKREFTTVSADVSQVRAEPSTNSEPPVDEITKDTTVEVLERYDDSTWAKISYGDGKIGYVNGEHLWRAAGLYESGMYCGNMGLQKAANWLKKNAKDNGSYTIVLGKDEAVKFVNFSYEQKTVTITLIPAGADERTVQYSSSKPKYSLFTVGQGVTFIMEDGLNLVGKQGDTCRMVSVESGTFIMNGGSIRDNNSGGVYVSNSGAFTMNNGRINDNHGGGVCIDSGSFTMNKGSISGNSSMNGGGVFMSNGTFIMNDGIINKNNATPGDYVRRSTGFGGGGVCIEGGTFTMNNGTISENEAKDYGGGVRIDGATFTMNNGTISGNKADQGGGVSVQTNATFTKSNRAGIIYGSNAADNLANKASSNSNGHAVVLWDSKYSINTGRTNTVVAVRNSTAGASQAMDSGKKGAAGGWQ